MKRGKATGWSVPPLIRLTAGAAWRHVTQADTDRMRTGGLSERSLKGGMTALPGAARKKLPASEESRILGSNSCRDGCSRPVSAGVGLTRRQPAARYSGFRSMTPFELANPRPAPAFI